MPYVTGPVLREGPVLDLLIGVSGPRRQVLERMGFPIPALVPVRALLDIRSEFSQMSAEVFTSLDLTPAGEGNMVGPAAPPSPGNWRQFDVSVWRGEPVPELCWPLVTVHEAVFPPDSAVRAVIGRDVLSHCLLIYDGRQQMFTLAW